MGHAFVKARFRGKDVVEFEKILIDTGASFTVMPLDIAENTLSKLHSLLN